MQKISSITLFDVPGPPGASVPGVGESSLSVAVVPHRTAAGGASVLAPAAAGAAVPLGLSLSHKWTQVTPKPDLLGAVDSFPDLQPGEFDVTVGRGGSCVKVRQLSRSERFCGERAKRGQVKGFSRASHLNMLSLVNLIDRSTVAGTIFVTLTVRHDPDARAGADEWKEIEHKRRAYMARFRRQWHGRRYFVLWKKEPHRKSGFPHLHLLVFFLDSLPHLVKEFRPWNDAAWAEVLNPSNPDYAAPACRTEFMRTWNGVGLYCAKYCAKVFEGDVPTGRVWGVENKGNLKAAQSLDRFAVSESVGVKFKRCLRKLLERRRTRWLVQATARSGEQYWRPIKDARCNLGDGEKFMTVAEQVECYRDFEIPVRLKKGRACRHRKVYLWAWDQESGCMVPGSSSSSEFDPDKGLHYETESITTGTHFIESGQAVRLLQFLILSEHGGGDELPF